MRLNINPNVRNVIIVLVLAGLVVAIPGGGTASSVFIAAISLLFFGAFVFGGTRLYREHRTTIYSLGDGRRAIIYTAAAVAVLVISATSKMWSSGVGTIAWILLLGACAYAAFVVIWAQRQY
jgi:predicted ABC-type exoprotein transport system permease subunit